MWKRMQDMYLLWIWIEAFSDPEERLEHGRQEWCHSLRPQAGRQCGQKPEGGQPGELLGEGVVVCQPGHPLHQAVQAQAPLTLLRSISLTIALCSSTNVK